MPRYTASISEMLTMPVGVLTTNYIDVWCNTATDTPHKIRVGDMIAVKWNADSHDREMLHLWEFRRCGNEYRRTGHESPSR